MISVYSTLSAVLFFNISMLAVYLLRRKNGFLAAYTAPVLRFLTLLGAVRLFLPLDVEKAWVIALPELLPLWQKKKQAYRPSMPKPCVRRPKAQR